MRILIIGGEGMLGSMLCQILANFDLTCWDREEIDITNAGDVRQKLTQHRPDIIINAAAYTDVDGAETNRELAFAVNEAGVRHVATATREIGATLVHYSTDYVFAGDRRAGYAEKDSPGPAANAYGESKLAGERVLGQVKPRYYLIRTAWLYGPGGRNFVDTMLELAKTEDVIEVVRDQHGSPTFTKDVANATETMLTKSYRPGIYHVVNQGITDWFKFAQKIFEYADVHVRVKPTTSDQFSRPARRPGWSVLRNTMGPAMRSWSEALREYIELIKHKA